MTPTTPTSRRPLLGAKIKVDLNDMDIESWRVTCGTTARPSANSLDEMRKITPEHDLKLQELKRIVLAKVAQPINPGNKKVLIFSAFADTANYLYRELTASARSRPAGQRDRHRRQPLARRPSAPAIDFQQVLTLFSPKSKQRTSTMPKETASWTC
jgi:hypothetical protein